MNPSVPHGFIFYPRSYFIQSQNFDENYIDGVDAQGVARRVYLNPDDRARQAARSNSAETIPLVHKLADTSRRATNPCFAAADNGPEKPCGVLLIEQASLREDGHVQSRWASVLSESDETPPPEVGTGTLEMSFHPKIPSEISHLISQYNQLSTRTDIDSIQQKAALHNEIIDGRMMWFVASMLKHDLTIELGDRRQAVVPRIENAIARSLDHFTRNGHYGGAWIRIKTGEGIILDACASIYRQFDYKGGTNAPQSIDEVMGKYRKFIAPKVMRGLQMPGSSIDIIPVERVNAGKPGNEKFKKAWMARPDGGVPKLQKLFVDKTGYLDPINDPCKTNTLLAAPIAVRQAKVYAGPTAGNLLVSTVHAFGKPIGHPLQVGVDGQLAYPIRPTTPTQNPTSSMAPGR